MKKKTYLEELKAKSAEQLNEELVSQRKNFSICDSRMQPISWIIQPALPRFGKTSLGFRLLSLRKRKREKGEQNNGKKSEKNPYR